MADGHINGRAGLAGTVLGPSLFSGHGCGFVGTPDRS